MQACTTYQFSSKYEILKKQSNWAITEMLILAKEANSDENLKYMELSDFQEGKNTGKYLEQVQGLIPDYRLVSDGELNVKQELEKREQEKIQKEREEKQHKEEIRQKKEAIKKAGLNELENISDFSKGKIVIKNYKKINKIIDDNQYKSIKDFVKRCVAVDNKKWKNIKRDNWKDVASWVGKPTAQKWYNQITKK